MELWWIILNYDIIIMHWTPWFCVSCQQRQQFMKDFLDSITVPYSTTWCMVCWTYIYGSTILCNLEANNGSKRRGLNPLDGRWICPFFSWCFCWDWTLKLSWGSFCWKATRDSHSNAAHMGYFDMFTSAKCTGVHGVSPKCWIPF